MQRLTTVAEHGPSMESGALEGEDAYCIQQAIRGIFYPQRRTIEYDQDMNASPTGRKTVPWPWIASIWFAVGLFTASQNVLVMRAEGMRHAWVRLFVTLLLSWLVWALATPLVLALGRRYPPVRLRPVYIWLIHLACCGIIALASSAWEASLQKLMNPLALSDGPGPFLLLWLDTFYNGLFQALYLYAALVAISHILDSRERLVREQIETARLNELFSQAQLEILRRQIEPHFLFNALNAIVGLVREKRNDAAVTMTAGLSEFLRNVVQSSDRQTVPLEEEIHFVEKYLDIQKVRFADRLQFTLDVPKELLSVHVPSLILQPIVENAVKHGIARQSRGGRIRVTAFQSNGRLNLVVYNDGPDLPEGWEKTGPGIGIANVRSRLQTMYGDEFELSLRNQASGVEVLASVPFQET